MGERKNIERKEKKIKQNKNYKIGFKENIEKQNKNVGWCGVIRGNSIVALFSLWVREVLGSIPSCPLIFRAFVCMCSYSSVG